MKKKRLLFLTQLSISFLKTSLSSSFSVKTAKKQNSVNMFKMKMRF